MNNITHLRCLLCFAVLASFPAIVSAQTQSDKNQSFWRQIQKYDRQVSQGHVVYRRDVAKDGKSQVYRYDLKYDSKSRYAEQIMLPGVNGTTMKTVFDGKDSFSVNGDTIVITKGLPFKTDLTSFWVLGVCAKPSLPLGRGLSQLTNPQLSWNGDQATVKGSVTDGTNLIALVDTKDHHLVRNVKRFTKDGKLIFEMVNSGTSKDGLATTKSILKISGTVETSTFVATSFAPQPESTFHVPLKGKLKILDQRLGMAPVNVKTHPKEISKDELLGQTRSILQRMAQQKARAIAAEKKQSLINMSVLAAPFLLLITWVLILRTKKNRREA